MACNEQTLRKMLTAIGAVIPDNQSLLGAVSPELRTAFSTAIRRGGALRIRMAGDGRLKAETISPTQMMRTEDALGRALDAKLEEPLYEECLAVMTTDQPVQAVEKLPPPARSKEGEAIYLRALERDALAMRDHIRWLQGTHAELIEGQRLRDARIAALDEDNERLRAENATLRDAMMAAADRHRARLQAETEAKPAHNPFAMPTRGKPYV